MKRIDGSDLLPRQRKGPAVALGNFDGVHLGHQRLIERIRKDASELGVPSAVYTFEPHPVKVLAPSQCPRLLTTLEQKLRHLERYGVETTIVEPFDREFAHLTAEEFFDRILLERLRPSSIVVGYDFTFGLHRGGTIETIEEFGRKNGIGVSIVPAVFMGETLISSTVIRKLILERQIVEADSFLGRPYEISGEVITGRGLGRSLGARTANIITENEIIPGDGVYATLTAVEGESLAMPSVTSIGDNPTFPDARYSIETHVLDGEVDLTGKRLSIHFLAFMRESIRFSTVEELKAQIARDIEEAKAHHSKRGKPSLV